MASEYQQHLAAVWERIQDLDMQLEYDPDLDDQRRTQLQHERRRMFVYLAYLRQHPR